MGLMAQQIVAWARAPCVRWLLLFDAMRVRIKLNGSDSGGMLVVQDGWGLPEFIHAAKLKLLDSENRHGGCLPLAGSPLAWAGRGLPLGRSMVPKKMTRHAVLDY